MNGRCPSCGAELSMSDYAEILRCPRCRSRFHPEAVRASRKPGKRQRIAQNIERRINVADARIAELEAERDRYREALERIATTDAPYPRIIARYALDPERRREASDG